MKAHKRVELKIKTLLDRFNPPIKYTVSIEEDVLKVRAPKHIVEYLKTALKKDRTLFESYEEENVIRVKSKEFDNTEYILEAIGDKLYITRNIDGNLSSVEVPEDLELDSPEEVQSLGDRLNKEMRFGL